MAKTKKGKGRGKKYGTVGGKYTFMNVVPKRTARGRKMDGRIGAKAPGKRRSKNGNEYSERRDNRADFHGGRKKGKRV
ncbi:TPA_asm: hypothetical protein [Altiarchaeum virus]|nr:MAG: hypothetical protein BWK75_01150 [Candidatus Altiarchaeales archaeon A3]DAZ85521.1 TPA_asm: hypothetical protein [Altiarchaeum virus]